MLGNLNLTRGIGEPSGSSPLGGNRLNLAGVDALKTATVARALAGMAVATPQPAAPPPSQPAAPAAPPTKLASLIQPEIAKTIQPAILTINPAILTTLLDKTTTQLARGAIQQLTNAGRAIVEEAINTVANRNVTPANLMNHLERRVKIGEVLNSLARQWSQETVGDFAEAFNMDRSKLDVMDAIVSLAILNDPELEDELRVENMSQATDAALLENRRVVWQYPPPGTPLDPPYLVLVAVEHQDLTQATEVIDSIVGQLVTHQGAKVPRAVVSGLTAIGSIAVRPEILRAVNR